MIWGKKYLILALSRKNTQSPVFSKSSRKKQIIDFKVIDIVTTD